MQVITGPNMGGKSTYMRQVAIVVLLASIGSYVPADACRLGPIDAIHTRIGAADDLANAQSTFMLEMTEAAQILHAATPHSLVLMDEIGRGTSTFDGLALASGIAAHLHDKTQAFTLFATHYFELTEFPANHRAAVNVHVSAVESGADIVFLHEIQAGPASRSYGIQVARLAGMPAAVVNHARHALAALESQQTEARAQVDLFAPPARHRGRTDQPRRIETRGHRPRCADPARRARCTVCPEKNARRRLRLSPNNTGTFMTYCVCHQARCRPGFPVRLAHQRRPRPDQHLPQDDRLRKAGRPLHGAAVGGQPQHLAVGARDPAGRAAQGPRGRRSHHHLERQEHVRRGPGARLGGAPRVRNATPARCGKVAWNSNVSLIFGGQIKGEGMRLFQVYSPGNFIEATPETPYFQVGESKYGKPVLDRVITPSTPLNEAAKCALVSMDSTLKSNLSVGLPLDMVVYEANRFQTDKVVCIDENNPYFQMLHGSWGQKLREVFDSIEDPVWDGAATNIPLMATLGPRQAIEEDQHARRETHLSLIVFSHANSFPASTYGVLFKSLRARGFTVRAVEKFGHDARYPVTNNWPHLVQQLADFAERETQKAGEPAFLVGHSLGGFLSLMCAARHPKLARGVLLIDSPVLGGWRATTLGVIKRTQLVGSVSPGAVSRRRRDSWPDAEGRARALRAQACVLPNGDPQVLDDYIRHGTRDADGQRVLAFDRAIETAIYNTPARQPGSAHPPPPAQMPLGVSGWPPVG